ncbi:MAG: DUF2309 domain-containing protein [Sulfurimonas sp.]|nr:DUF2309 domain-containing protein [Sulfurimonas sp.]MBU3940114.1 DUF2309 domain-containing protein [bacterium]MBU4024707.1 DUF2309 domain-containing protein [bacterium]MBU4060095.1 DUF2309 domain-containing protein [bacterium]MBU4110204.1 DUF2309 domain-containing protein [bacterium]
MIVKEKDILFIDSLVESAVEHIPNFWPMKSFIHHNPLHGFENMHFEEAVNKAHTLFHAKKSLTREQYQRFYQEGKIEDMYLREELENFGTKCGHTHPLLENLFIQLMTKSRECHHFDEITNVSPLIPQIAKNLSPESLNDYADFNANLVKHLAKEKTIYDVVDMLFATNVGEALDDIMSQIAMRFLGEGQAIWNMPKREKGMFLSWKEIVMQDKVFFNENETLCRLLRETALAEDIIFMVLKELKIPRSFWEEYFTLELTKLHGWSGFLKYRSKSSSEYQKKYPAFMEEFLAIRLYYSYMLLKKQENSLGFFPSMKELGSYIMNNKEEAFLRAEYNSGKLLLSYFQSVENFLHETQKTDAKEIYDQYIYDKKIHDCEVLAEYLYKVLSLVLKEEQIQTLQAQELNAINAALQDFEDEEGFIWLKAMEKTSMMQLMSDYVQSKKTQEQVNSSDAQLFFCIDTRSERIRRNIEAAGAYETYGMAGFFGIPFKSIDVSNRCESDLCPAILTPKHIVYSFHEKEAINSKGLMKIVKKVLNELKYNVLTPYVTVEAIGALFAFDFFGKSLVPKAYMPLRKKIFDPKVEEELRIERYTEKEATESITAIQNQIIKFVIEEKFNIKPSSLDDEILNEIREIALSKEDIVQEDQDGVAIDSVTKLGAKYNLLQIEEQRLIELLRKEYKVSAGHMRIQKAKMAKVGFSFKEQLYYVQSALKTVGLKSFCDIVVLSAHASQSENNPYESALDCGACGGSSSLINAKVLAYMANKQNIREELHKHGIHIPEQTYFIAALHNTTSDVLTLFDAHAPHSHHEALKKLKADLELAGMLTAAERMATLPLSNTRSKQGAFSLAKRNTMDWSQPRPEWGLSKNHSFFIGKRENSKNMNLAGRTFLHSYDYTGDKKGAILSVILSGPLVVGEWINMEHFFSTLDNSAFGSESKVYHNVVGKLGVISGNMSDLRTGLPSQTVNLENEPYHEPLRLITMIEAPFETHKNVIDKIHKISELVYNEWIKTIFIDEKETAFFLYEGNTQTWEKLEFKTFTQGENRA